MSSRPISDELCELLESLVITDCVEFHVTNGHTKPIVFATKTDATAAAEKRNERMHRVAYTTAEIAQGQIAKGLYTEFKKVLEAVGGKWESHRKQHRFPADPRPLLEAIIRNRVIPDLNPLDFYPTPRPLVDSILNCAWVQDAIDNIRFRREAGTKIRALEPSAGSGAFTDRLVEFLGDEAVLSLEMNPLNVEILLRKGHQVVETDFLQWKTDERFELIVLNPPFAGKTWRKHLQHAFSFLAPFGRLVCIAPSSIKIANNAKDTEFLRWLLTRGSLEENEDGAFAESGTNVPTVTIFLENEEPVRKPADGYPSYDALMFDITVSGNQAEAERYRAVVENIRASLTDQELAKATARTLPPDLRESFFAMCNTLNDVILTKHATGCNLIDEDIAFLLDGELSELRLNHGIEADIPAEPEPKVATKGTAITEAAYNHGQNSEQIQLALVI